MVGFLVAIILIAAGIWLAMVARWFRWILACIAVVLIVHFANLELSRKREAAAAKKRISFDQVEFTGLCMAGAIPQADELTEFSRAKIDPPLNSLSAADRCRVARVLEDRIKSGTLSERQLPNARAVRHELSMLDYSAQDLLKHPQITGRIRNLSPTYRLKELTLRVSVQDCAALERGPERTPQAAQFCDIIGETSVTSYVDVPPMQSRAYEQSVSFSALPEPRGNYRWNYTIIEVTGGVDVK